MTRPGDFAFEVLRDNLYFTCEEMMAHLLKVAYSTIIRESHDCATGITDTRGRVVAQSAGTPGTSAPYRRRQRGCWRPTPSTGSAPATSS